MSEGQINNEQSKPSNSIRANVFKVNRGDLLKIRVNAIDELMANERALVCQIAFFDGQGQRIDDEVKGASISPKFGSFIYIGTGQVGESALWARETIHTPNDAVLLHLTLYPWKSSPQLRIEQDIECRDYRKIAPDSLTSTILPGETKRNEHEILPFWRIAYSFELLKKANGQDAVLKVLISFLNAAGDSIEAKQSSVNAIFGAVQEYDDVTVLVQAETKTSEYDGFIKMRADIQLLAPPQAVKIRVTTQSGPTDPRVLLTQNFWAFEALIESRLTVEAIANIHQCASLPRNQHKYSYVKLLEKFPDTLSAYTTALSYFCSHNHFREITSAANQILNRFQQGEAQRMAKNALAHAVSHNPGWLPNTGKPVETSQIKDAMQEQIKVAHLLHVNETGNDLGETGQISVLAFQKKMNVANAFIVTPTCNPVIEEQATVWALLKTEQVTRYDMNCLSFDDTEKIPATTLLSFTAIVAKQILMVESANVIHAHDSYQAYNFALIGLALSQALHVPLIYERRRSVWEEPGDRSTVSSSAIDAGLQQELRCMREAHAIILPANTETDRLMGHGIDREKIFFLPDIMDKSRTNTDLDKTLRTVSDIYLQAYHYAGLCYKNEIKGYDAVAIKS